MNQALGPGLVTDVYELKLATSSRLKLRAKALMAEGGLDRMFEACVLLHEAARIERRSVDALGACPPVTRLRASIEECGCLLQGHDPPAAAAAWGRVLRDGEQVDAAARDALLVHIRPQLEAIDRRFKKVLAGSPHLLRTRGGGSLVPPTREAQLAVHGEVVRLLEAFPGATSFWWASHRLLEALGDTVGAWQSLARARRLDPENPRFRALSLLLATRALSEPEADEHIERSARPLEEAGPEVCLMYALATLELAKKSRARERWVRSLDAAQLGLSQASSEGLRRSLRATQLVVTALLSGKEPTMDLLYRAGLGESVVEAHPSRDVVELLVWLGSREIANDAARATG